MLTRCKNSETTLNAVVRQTQRRHESSVLRGTPGNNRIYFIFLASRVIGLHFAADSVGLYSVGLSSFKYSNFSGGIQNMHFFHFME